jgi:hypothetical protein
LRPRSTGKPQTGSDKSIFDQFENDNKEAAAKAAIIVKKHDAAQRLSALRTIKLALIVRAIVAPQRFENLEAR